MKKNHVYIFLLIILLAGSFLRFHRLGETSLSNDELSAITRARYDSFRELVEHGIKVDGHPALVQTMIWATIKLFNDDVFTIRLPFAWAGIISIFLIFLLAKRWFGSGTALLSAASLATLQFPLLYSQIARPYEIGLMFTLAFALCWTRFTTDEKPNKWIWTGYIISGAGCIYTHYFSFMLAGIIGVSGFFFIRKNNLRAFLICNGIIVLSFLPSISIFNQQFGYGGIGGWLSPPDHRFFSRFVNYCFNESPSLQLVYIMIFLASMHQSSKLKTWKKFHAVSLIWFLLPFFIGFCYSIWKAPVLQYSTLIFALPFAILFIFSWVNEQWLPAKVIYMFAFFVLACGIYSTAVERKYYSTNHFGVFKELAEKSKAWDQQYGDKGIIKQFSLSNPEYINYYFRKMSHDPRINIYSDDEQSTYGLMTGILDTTKADYYEYAWTNAAHAYETMELIMEKYPVVVENDTFFNSQIVLFGKGNSSSAEKIISESGLEKDNWDDETKKQSGELFHTGSYSQKMNPDIEYSISFKKPSAEIHAQADDMLKAEAWFYGTNTIRDASLVIAFVNGDKLDSYAEMPLKNFYTSRNKWTRVIVYSSIPDENAEVRVYIWNKQRETFYIDDLKVSLKKKNKVFRPI